MKERLKLSDKRKIEKLNLFRFDNNWYIVLYGVCIFSFVYSFFFPYLGWRHKPLNPPEDLQEYVKQVLKINTFYSPMYLLSICNLLIKAIELKKDVKTYKVAKVRIKTRLLFNRKLILFKPFLLIVYKRPIRFPDVENGTYLKLELTYFGRLLNCKLL